MKDAGVKNIHVSIGTVDLLQLPESVDEPKHNATEVAESITQISQYLSPDIQLCAVIPAPNYKVSEIAYSTDSSAKLKNTDVCTAHAAHVMEYI